MRLVGMMRVRVGQIVDIVMRVERAYLAARVIVSIGGR